MRTGAVRGGPVWPEPAGWAVSRWSADPYARGAWTGLLTGGSSADRAALAVAFAAGRVVLAGEGVHPDRPAMLHGAHESGLSAARRPASA